ncbi:hypothetical protein JAAARDRAFT_421843 [Jaapia argillacea MUCL 33604]|uniref:Uncharacterized protein n=1 Tax=Jaapia argillacea MUCL 33604 TaxID=933084 RepID=A0A067PG10_9AGAM|nr:hypothetical protein JAAARDRAFT_421843 [Jaapia argillacea MUCL 33604]
MSDYPMNETSRPPPLPVELYSHIFTFVDSHTYLRRLCLVSRAFYHAAVPFVYHTIHLDYSDRQIKRLRLIIRTNPELALHVRELTLIPGYLSEGSTIDLAEEIFTSLHNLRVLTIDSLLHDFKDFTRITRNCRSQLHTLHNKYVHLTDYLPFLKSQSNITNWTHLAANRDLTLLENSLPNLTTMCVEASLLRCFTTPRPVKQLYVCYDPFSYADPGLEDSIPLGPFRDTLATLSWDRSLSWGSVGGPAAISSIAEQVPHLKHLCVIDVPDDVTEVRNG